MLKGFIGIAASTAAALGTALAAGGGLPKDFFWDRDREIAVARSAAPETLSAKATVWVLTRNGYEKAVEGENGANCLVTRGWSAPFDTDLFGWPELVAPICYDAIASGAPMKEQILRAELGLKGKSHDEIKAAVYRAYADGELRQLDRVGLSYMYSHAQVLGPTVGHWHPHLMIHAPYYTNDLLGPNTISSGDPVVVEAGGTGRAIIAVPVNGREHHISPKE